MAGLLETDAEAHIEKMEAEIADLRNAVGALIACLVRVGVEGRAPFIGDQETLGLRSKMGHIGIPPNAAKILRRYASEAAAADD